MELRNRVKFYADSPNGADINKYLVYDVQDIQHAIDLVNRFLSKGWIVRACFYQTPEGANIRIPNNILEK
jgi:hypothetical protein